jgi:hypothetical protein
VPTFTAAAHIIVGSDLTGLIPARYARQVADLTGACRYEIPAALPALTMSQAWHVRHDMDPAHHWLRTQIPSQRPTRRARRRLITIQVRRSERILTPPEGALRLQES